MWASLLSFRGPASAKINARVICLLLRRVLPTSQRADGARHSVQMRGLLSYVPLQILRKRKGYKGGVSRNRGLRPSVSVDYTPEQLNGRARSASVRGIVADSRGGGHAIARHEAKVLDVFSLDAEDEPVDADDAAARMPYGRSLRDNHDDYDEDNDGDDEASSGEEDDLAYISAAHRAHEVDDDLHKVLETSEQSEDCDVEEAIEKAERTLVKLCDATSLYKICGGDDDPIAAEKTRENDLLLIDNKRDGGVLCTSTYDIRDATGEYSTEHVMDALQMQHGTVKRGRKRDSSRRVIVTEESQACAEADSVLLEKTCTRSGSVRGASKMRHCMKLRKSGACMFTCFPGPGLLTVSCVVLGPQKTCPFA